MTEKQRDKIINYTFSLITSIIVVLIAFSLNAKRDNNLMLSKKIEEKLDKKEYIEDKKKNDLVINNIQKMQNESIAKITEATQQIAIQNASMSADIAWIKKALDDNKKNKR